MHAARLRRNADIAAVRAGGPALQHRLFALRARTNDLGAMRFAVSAPRSLGTAVARNRSRRRLREAFRIAVKTTDLGGHDIVLTARRDLASASPGSLREAVASALASLAKTEAAVR